MNTIITARESLTTVMNRLFFAAYLIDAKGGAAPTGHARQSSHGTLSGGSKLKTRNGSRPYERCKRCWLRWVTNLASFSEVQTG